MGQESVKWYGQSTRGKIESYVIHKPADCKGLMKCIKKEETTDSKQKSKKIKIKETLAQEATVSSDNDDGYDT